MEKKIKEKILKQLRKKYNAGQIDLNVGGVKLSSLKDTINRMEKETLPLKDKEKILKQLHKDYDEDQVELKALAVEVSFNKGIIDVMEKELLNTE